MLFLFEKKKNVSHVDDKFVFGVSLLAYRLSCFILNTKFIYTYWLSLVQLNIVLSSQSIINMIDTCISIRFAH